VNATTAGRSVDRRHRIWPLARARPKFAAVQSQGGTVGSSSEVRVGKLLAICVLAACQPTADTTGGMAGIPNMPADASGPNVPAGVAQFAVDPFWPQPLPNNWIIGQVAGLSIDKANDHIWIIHRPWTVQATNAGATPPQSVRDNAWGSDPVQSTCCLTAPPVIEFDAEGNVLRSFGAGAGYDWFNSEHGIHVDHNGKVWVAGNGANDHHMMRFTQPSAASA
jgi:hypothetical protein